MRQVIIYSLIDPRDNIIKYVGKTVQSCESRYKQHIYQWKRENKNHNRVNNWIKFLSRINLKPIMKPLAFCNESNWKEYERGYIKLLKGCGADLKNSTLGGDEMPKNSKSKEAKIKRLNTLKTSKAWKEGHINRSLSMITSNMIFKFYKCHDLQALERFDK